MSLDPSAPDPEEIMVSVNAVFDLRFERDPERGGYLVTCQELPEVAGWGRTLRAARADSQTEIKHALQDRAEDGVPIPTLRYARRG